MGGAFLLLETKNVVQFALLFGTTWSVNAAVFTGVLLSVLAAIEVARRLRCPAGAAVPRAARRPRRCLADPAGDAAARPARRAALRRRGHDRVPADLPGEPALRPAVQGVGASTVAFGANLLGAMVGGALEYLALILGSTPCSSSSPSCTASPSSPAAGTSCRRARWRRSASGPRLTVEHNRGGTAAAGCRPSSPDSSQKADAGAPRHLLPAPRRCRRGRSKRSRSEARLRAAESSDLPHRHSPRRRARSASGRPRCRLTDRGAAPPQAAPADISTIGKTGAENDPERRGPWRHQLDHPHTGGGLGVDVLDEAHELGRLEPPSARPPSVGSAGTGTSSSFMSTAVFSPLQRVRLRGEP